MADEVVFKDFDNVHHMLVETAKTYPQRAAYRWFTAPGVTDSITWTGFLEEVHRVAKSLIALGVGKGDKVNILSYSCYRWILTDFGIASMGGCTVGIYQSNLPEDCKYIINHSDGVLIFVENQEQLDKVLAVREEIPAIRKVIVFGDFHKTGDDWVIDFDSFLELGAEVSDEVLQQHIDVVKKDDPATIVYTSGTTGVPKGAVLSNDNITFTPQSVSQCVDIQGEYETFLFLPLAHVFARICVFSALMAGIPTTIARSMETVVEDVKHAKPHWFASVPRVYEKVYSKVVGTIEAKGGLSLTIFRWASKVGARVSEFKQHGKPLPPLLKMQYGLATKLVFHKIQDIFGGQVDWCISGAAPLNPDIGRFFHAAGILILEGIGMTENTSFTNVNRYTNYRFGWVGPTGPGIEMKVGDDGEVYYLGRNVMKEYYKMPEETAATIDADGWQASGDLGEIDDEGFLKITGRKKDLIITAGGKNIAPSAIEGLLITSKYIAQACVVGDRRKFLTALVTLDPDNVQEFAKSNGIEFESMDDLMTRPEIITLIDAEVQGRNRRLASFETIKKIHLVPEFTIENGLLTPSMKVKRNLVVEHHKDTIEEMYKEE